MVTIPLRCSSPKLQPLMHPSRPERTLLGQIPCQPLLTYLLQGHHGQFPQVKPQWPYSFKTEKAEDRTLPKIATIPHVMVNKPPQIKQRKCMDGDCIAPSAQNPPQIPGQRIKKIGMVKDKTSWKETIIPQALTILHRMTF